MIVSLLALLLTSSLLAGVACALAGWHRASWHLMAWAVLMALLLGLAAVGEQASRLPILREILGRRAR